MYLGVGSTREGQLALNKAGLGWHTHGRDDEALTPQGHYSERPYHRPSRNHKRQGYSPLLWKNLQTKKAQQIYHGDCHVATRRDLGAMTSPWGDVQRRWWPQGLAFTLQEPTLGRYACVCI